MATQTIGPERSFLSIAQIDTAAIGTLNLVPPVAGKRVRVYQLLLNVHADQLATFKDTAASTLLPQQSLAGKSGLGFGYNGMPYFETGVGFGLDLAITAAVQTSGLIWYTQVSEVLP